MHTEYERFPDQPMFELVDSGVKRKDDAANSLQAKLYGATRSIRNQVTCPLKSIYPIRHMLYPFKSALWLCSSQKKNSLSGSTNSACLATPPATGLRTITGGLCPNCFPENTRGSAPMHRTFTIFIESVIGSSVLAPSSTARSP